MMTDPRRREQALEVRLEVLTERAERLRGHLPFVELRELARLYRAGLARLAALRTRSRDPEAVRYLNGLCVRAYTHVYAAPRGDRSAPSAKRLWETLSRTWRTQLLAAALLSLGAVLGAFAAEQDPRVRASLVGFYSPAELARLETSAAARSQFLERQATSFNRNAHFGTSLFFHNTRVGLGAFALGILAGAPTLALLVYNGLVLGAFGSLFMSPADRISFLAWIVPHAIPELLAVILCATAGLLLGKSVVAPGRLPFRESMRRHSAHALRLVGISIPLFLLAAGIESFVRESTLTTPARLAVAAIVFAALLAYVLLIAGRARAQPAPDLAWLRLEPGGRDEADADSRETA
jgi:uncharacterized membrane protein SpoIIM required for sporulation